LRPVFADKIREGYQLSLGGAILKSNRRTWTIIFAGLGLLALVLLAVSLNAVEMRPGQRISFGDVAPELAPTPGSAGGPVDSLMNIFRVLIIFAWVFLPIYIIYLLKSKEARKRLLRDLALFAPVLILLYIMSNNTQPREGGEMEFGDRGPPSVELGELPGGDPMPVFVEPPPWVTTVTSIALAVALTLILGGIVYFVWRRSRREAVEPLRAMEREAQAAIDAIEAGGDLRDVIIRCYLQMIEALNVYRNIQRDRDMTPHEFELYLERRGLPRGPVHDLTELFERVRYGSRNPGRQDERKALNSLSAIVSACQKTKSA
jgi:hypothetical protein